MWRKILRIKKGFFGGKKVSSQGEAFLTCLEYKDDDYCIAHCLEFDIVAQGKTFEEANESLAELIKEQINFAVDKDLEDKVLFHPAPSKYWDILRNLKTKMAKKELLGNPNITTSQILNRIECVPAHAYSR